MNIFFIGTRQQLQRCNGVNTLDIAGNDLKINDSLKILGVTLDLELSFKSHVNQIVKACNYHLWSLRHIRKYLTVELANTIACSLVGSKLDYCNSILSGTLAANVEKLQRVQNNLSRIVLNKPRRAHSLELRKALHWLPISSRIDYKMALITFKALSSGKPSYLTELLSVHQPARVTRSSSCIQLAQPIARSQVAGRGFRYQAPTIWNHLPTDIRASTSIDSFKSN